MPKDGIVYLLKFAPQEAYIDDLMDGRLYMNAAGYYHGLPGEQGDPQERLWRTAWASTPTGSCRSTACSLCGRATLLTTLS